MSFAAEVMQFLKKDWKVLRWSVIGVFGLFIILSIADITEGYFPSQAQERNVTLAAVLAFAAGLLVLESLIHQDSVAGIGGDWVVRPVRWRALITAKICFAVIAFVPLTTVAAVDYLIRGFDPIVTINATISDSGSALLWIIPLFAFYSLFRSLTETLAGILIGLALIIFANIAISNNDFPHLGPIANSSISWIVEDVYQAAMVVGGILIIFIQYRSRATILGRCLVPALLIIAGLTRFFPWNTAFAIQQRIAPLPEADSHFSISALPGTVSRIAEEQFRNNGRPALCVPLSISAVPEKSWLNTDSLRVRIVDGSGTTVWDPEPSFTVQYFAGNRRPETEPLLTSVWEMPGGGNCQPVSMTSSDLARLSSIRNARIQLDYSLTMFGPDKTFSLPIPSSERDVELAGLGPCRTKPDSGKVVISCISSDPPDSAASFVWDESGRTIGRPSFWVTPDFGPWRHTNLQRWGGSLSVALPPAAVVKPTYELRTYRILGHTTRQVTIPVTRLQDFVPVKE